MFENISIFLCRTLERSPLLVTRDSKSSTWWSILEINLGLNNYKKVHREDLKGKTGISLDVSMKIMLPAISVLCADAAAIKPPPTAA